MITARELLLGARDFASAVTSPEVDAETATVRLSICESCEHYKRDGDGVYCGACICPHWRLAELRRKVRFVRAKCPHKKW